MFLIPFKVAKKGTICYNLFRNSKVGDNIINTSFLKKVLILLSCISLLVTISFFNETYGKYLTNLEDETDIKIARWKILVNGTDVRNNSTTESTITPIFNDNDNIENDVIAPTSEGYFDVVIDGSGADVSFEYSITTTVNDESSVKDLVITGYSINEEEKIETSDSNISNIVPLTQQNKIINIRVFIKWDDSESSTMSNEEDTLATMSDGAKLDVSLSFKQIAE